MSVIVRLIDRALPADVLAHLDDDEASGAREVSARSDTYSVFAMQGEKLLGYAVFGKDKGGLLSVYYARSLVPGLGPVMMRQFFGVAKIAGTPIRVHSEKVSAMARAFGAQIAIEATDADGVPVGVFA